MNAAFLLRSIVREARGSRARIAFFVACLAIGVAPVVGVAGLAAGIEAGLRSQSALLLGADVKIEAREPLPEDLDEILARVGAFERTDVRELATMALPAAQGEGDETPPSQLVELRVVQGSYPLRGALELEPPGTLDGTLTPDAVVVAPELLDRLGVRVGERLRIGGAEFTIAASVADDPDRLGFSLVIGPRVYVSGAGFDRTQLQGVGNRVRYRALLRVPGAPTDPELRRIEDAIEDRLPADRRIRVETSEDAQPSVRRGLERVERFLGLVALSTLLLGGLGVAEIVRTWIDGRRQAIAVLRSLGMTPRAIVLLHAAQVLALGLSGSVAGALLGTLFPLVVPRLASDLFPPGLVSAWQPLAIGRGLLLGTGLALVFALPALSAVWRVPPARVLRSDAEPLPPRRGAVLAAVVVLALGLFASAWVQAEDREIALGFTGGALVFAALAFGGARLVVRAAGAVPRGRLSPYLVNGIASLARPRAGTVGAIVALGLGATVVLALHLVERRLSEELDGALPPDAPTAFLVDVQPDQWPAVRGILADCGAENVSSVPVVMARLAAIDGEDVEALASGRGGRRARWVLTREQRLTFLDELPADNVVVEGALWSDPARDEVSVERGYAEDLGVGVGSTLVFDVQGVPVELLVTSVRTVEWEGFGINFFLVVEPGVLEEAPHFRIATGRLDEAGERALAARIARAAPNVTVIGVRPILEKVMALLARCATGVRLLGALGCLAGLFVLAGSAGAARLERGRDAALLKALGVTRGGVAALFATEYLLCGAVAGLLGALGGVALSYGFLVHVLELAFPLPWGRLAALVLLCALFAVLAGLGASLQALRTRPQATLARSG